MALRSIECFCMYLNTAQTTTKALSDGEGDYLSIGQNCYWKNVQQTKCKLSNMKINDFFFVKRKMNTYQHVREYLACLEFLRRVQK